ncbi:MAG: hypothetical protein R3B57_10475 [Phycisphaerales bacterium]
MRPPDLLAAADHIHALAVTTLGEPPIPPGSAARRVWAGTLTDESGARPRTAIPLLEHLADIPRAERTLSDVNDALWRLRGGPGPDPLTLVLPGDGPLLGQSGPGIESSTEQELAALHALGALGVELDAPPLWDRLWAAADWHVRELQPDNATNRPWAVHVFLLRASRCDDADLAAGARLHASTLLHNCQVLTGRPDRISACILLDAATILRRATDRAKTL